MATGSVTSSTGLSSGIDYATLLSSLKAASQGQITLYQNKQSTVTNKQTAMSTIKQAVSAFQTAAEALNSRDDFLTMTATSTSGTVLAANASSTAVAGTHSVIVKQLATADRIASQGVDDADSTSIADTAGKFIFSVGDGTSYTVNVTSGMTMNDLVDAINATGAKVTASVLDDGSETNPDRLVLTSNSTGATNKIKISQNDTKLNLSSTSIESAVADSDNTFDGTVTSSGTYTGSSTKNVVIQITSAGAVGTAKYRVSYDGGVTWGDNDKFTTSTSAVDVTGSDAEGINIAFGSGTKDFAVGDTFSIDAFSPNLQTAQNAIMTVDGVQVSRSTNTFENVISGVTLTAKSVSADKQTVTVANSVNSVSTKVSALVDAYNTLKSTIDQYTSWDTESETGGVLFGDSSVTQMLADFRASLTTQVSGLSSDVTMSSIGVQMGKDGQLTFDSDAFNTAMNSNLEDVVSLFIQTGNSKSSAVSYSKSTSDTQNGTYDVRITQAAEQATVSGSKTLSGGLTADETLTVGTGGTTVKVKLTSGSTISQIVDQLNSSFADKKMKITAYNDNGKLTIKTNSYGSEQSVSMVSDQSASSSGLGIGTETLTDKGVDVAGTVDGVAGTGDGQTLTIKSGKTKGLVLNITSSKPVDTTITLTRGVAEQLTESTDSYLETDTGLFASRDESYTDQISKLSDRITDLNDRLDTQMSQLQTKFNNLESQLASLSTQSSYVTSVLAQLVSSS